MLRGLGGDILGLMILVMLKILLRVMLSGEGVVNLVLRRLRLVVKCLGGDILMVLKILLLVVFGVVMNLRGMLLKD